MKETVVTVKNLVKRYNSQTEAVRGISFEIFKEELVAFIGPNGAGKTTTLKCLSGLLEPTKGEVAVLETQPFKREKDFLSKISFVTGHKNQLWWELPPMETFKLNKEIYQLGDKEYGEIVGEMIDILKIGDVVMKPTKDLSLGERMRCEIVASLLHLPELVFLDEPTLGLDVVSQYNLREFIKEYNHRYKATILLTSHNMEDISDLCKRVIVIDHGIIIYDGKLAELCDRYIKEKYIHFVLDKPIEPKYLEDLGYLKECTGNKGVLAVEKSRVSDVAKELLNKFSVIDLDINEPSLESIIKHIFENGSKI